MSKYKYITFQSTPTEELYIRALAVSFGLKDKSKLIKRAISELENNYPDKALKARELMVVA